MKNYYLTAAIPYVNAKPHLGHVQEWFQADSIARYQRSLGNTVIFSCGTDENSLKNIQAAEKAGKDPQAWLDEYADVFRKAFEHFNISITNFRRGSDQKDHWPGVQDLWNACNEAGDMYEKEYTGLYCVGCEAYYTPAELIDGKCPEHLTVPETITEVNYFFNLSKYQDQIKSLIESDTVHVISDQYKSEMLGFINQGLEDFSVSRSIQRARGIGVPVPGDNSQVMYVWFDALAIYLTSIGWGYDQENFKKSWPADMHVIGKGITRFHAIYWIAMLLSAKLELPKIISVHGYITVDGQKMSKSLGNVVDPFELVKEYGLESVRYFLLAHVPTHADGDFTLDRFLEVYNADLANGIGNLCSRVATLAGKHGLEGLPNTEQAFSKHFQTMMNEVALSDALAWVTNQIKDTDQFLSVKQPWKETDSEVRTEVLNQAIAKIIVIAYHLQPFMPHTAEIIQKHFTAAHITAFEQPLFPRT